MPVKEADNKLGKPPEPPPQQPDSPEPQPNITFDLTAYTKMLMSSFMAIIVIFCSWCLSACPMQDRLPSDRQYFHPFFQRALLVLFSVRLLDSTVLKNCQRL